MYEVYEVEWHTLFMDYCDTQISEHKNDCHSHPTPIILTTTALLLLPPHTNVTRLLLYGVIPP